MRRVAVVALVVWISFFYRLGSVGLFGPDESRYAQVAREMVERGDWVTPRLGGHPWLEKSPLYYWVAGASFLFLGETESSARLPSALAALITCLFAGRLGARLFGGPAGRAASLILATSLGLVIYGRAASMDSLLTMTLTLGLGAYALYATERPSLPRLGGAFGFFGAAVLAKGPLGLVLPLLILGAFHALRDRSLIPRAATAAVAAVAFLAVAAPWHLGIWRAQGREFVEVFLLEHNLDRFFTTIHRHPGPPYYYLPVLALSLFPWSVPLPLAIARAIRRSDPRRLFLLLWIAVPFLFFSLAGSKLPGYLIPVLPPCALLLGATWSEAKEGDRALTRSLGFHPALAAILGAAALYGFATRLPEIACRGWPLASVVAALGAGSYLASRRSLRLAFSSLAGSSCAMTLFLLFHTAPLLEPYQSLKALTAAAAPRLEPGERLICYKSFYDEALFYTRGQLGEIWTLEEFQNRTRERGRILTLTERPRYHELARAPELSVRILAEAGRRVLAEARPSP